MKSVTVLGSTGSVGTATVDLLKSSPESYRVRALTAQSNVSLLAKQAISLNAELAVIGDESLYADLQSALAGSSVKVACGRKAIIDAASEKVDWVMAAILGMAGLEPILAALKNSKHVAIANKEPLVSAGTLVIDTAKKHGATILPVDSEHNAIFQVFEDQNRESITRLILTASGGPFRTASLEEMERAGPAEAIAHPNWSMGAKISVDSAMMMNKALEVIEAHHLFGMKPEKIDVLVHPQSIIHSMVEYSDGSVLAQMGPSDMTVPIANCLGWPERISVPSQRLDFMKISALTFERHDPRRFPAINLAYDCLREGQAACAAMNAANEIAVDAFLKEQIGFLDIFQIVQFVVSETEKQPLNDLEAILFYDQQVRDATKRRILKTEFTNRKVS